ncbi:MAG TPA: HAMP domain-containing sensor histidine kinase, partial [Cytophagales bacterium]|nr:HAMP domain-containing sensor histidine kinase [Cytophagales bacterium]
RENVDVLYEQANLKNIRIEVLSNEDHLVFGDENMISTIVRNILGNSIKYTHKGGLIKVSSQSDHGKITIAIADEGVGMSQVVLSKLFSLDKGPSVKGTNKETGTGLGMVISQEFAMLNEGIITAESTLGKGSTFYVTLPKAE